MLLFFKFIHCRENPFTVANNSFAIAKFHSVSLKTHSLLLNSIRCRWNLFAIAKIHCTCIYPVVNDRWGAMDVATLSLHFILFSASLTASQNFNPVHSAILFSQRFFCRPLLLPPCTVPCKIVLASPDDLDTCPNHFNLRFFTVVKISS